MEEEYEEGATEKALRRLRSSCDKASSSKLTYEGHGNGGTVELGEERKKLGRKIAKALHDFIPRAAAFASKKGIPNPMTYLHEIVSLEEFSGSDGSTRNAASSASRKMESLQSPMWQALSTYNVCLDEYMRETLHRGIEPGTPAAEATAGGASGSGRSDQAQAMVAPFRKDIEDAMENGSDGEVGGEDKGRAELLMLGLMQGFDMLSELEKEVVVEASAP